MNIKKILAPTDFSDLSIAGLRYALDLAAAAGAKVVVYHAITPAELMDFGSDAPPRDFLERYDSMLRRFLDAHCSDLLPGVPVERKIEIGAADLNIVEFAAREGVDLIVMSTHGTTGLPRLLVGSVTEKVVRQAPCPVLSIRPAAGGKEAHATQPTT